MASKKKLNFFQKELFETHRQLIHKRRRKEILIQQVGITDRSLGPCTF